MTSIGSFCMNLSQEFGEIELNSNDVSAGDDQHIYGSNTRELLKAYEIDGISGISDWFAQFVKDLASPEGVPLPYAGAIQEITGMSTEQAINWLNTNLLELAEIGTEAALIAYFRKNPKAYSICLGFGMIFGFYNKNPLLIAMNGLQYFRKLRAEGRLQSVLWSNVDGFIRTSYIVVDRAATATFIADKALDLTGVNLATLAGRVIDTIRLGKTLTSAAQFTAEAASAVELVELVSNFGLSLLVGKVVTKAVDLLNKDIMEELAETGALVETRRRLVELLENEVPPEMLIPVLELLSAGGGYQAKLV
ncbi:MAG TPA: hypothetical protein VHY08_06150 [Bacillota bacterium]|nr:hypothetical protein [Bacillota bacterium]